MDISRIKSCYMLNNYSKNKVNAFGKINDIKKSDTIEISEFAKSIYNYAKDLDLNNSEKINDIKNRIENSTYNIDAKLTAKSILDSIKESKG